MIKGPEKYLFFWVLPFSAWISVTGFGYWTYATLILSFGIIPIIEFLFPVQEQNLSAEAEKKERKNPVYDYLLYVIPFIHWGILALFMIRLTTDSLEIWELVGRISAAGLMCGVAGINVAHELGHRSSKFDQFLAQWLLLSSFYQHFFIEHNKGHHRYVATPEDPSSARYREWIFTFWGRAVYMGYRSAWKIQLLELRVDGKSFFSINNLMLKFQIVQLVWAICVILLFPLHVAWAYFAAALMGILLLETVNYIEHYGLRREKRTANVYEKTRPWHSWNSNHILGRLLLFELSRHSDHHYAPQRKYQILKHHENAPQMPTGYPGMMLLSLLPPLFFAVMDRTAEKFGIKLDKA